MMSKKRVLIRSLITGFIGGLFWCLITLVASYFKIIDISPKTYLKLLFTNDKWLFKWYGTLFTVIVYGLISIFIAYIYYVLFKKIEGMLIGIFYGVGLAILVLFIFPQLYTDVPYLFKMSKRSITTSMCFFILYGTFIGYSISFDYKQMKVEMNNK